MIHLTCAEEVLERIKIVAPPDCEVIIDNGVIVIRKKKIGKSECNDS